MTPLKVLATKLNLIRHDEDPEPFILTKEEKRAAVLLAIQKQKEFFVWRRHNKGQSTSKIEAALSKVKLISWVREINLPEVLSYANTCKHSKITQDELTKERKESEKKKREELEKKCDATYMFRLMKAVSKHKYGKDLIVNEHTTHLIKTLCFFLSKDTRFETELGYSFEKGLWIRGLHGRGKTHCVKCVSMNEIRPISIHSLIDITETIKKDQNFELPIYDYLYLDDVGTEELDSKNYGSKITWFKNFIELIYLSRNNFSNLMVSTNDNFSKIESRYGIRVRSRLKDMFNFIDVHGPDMRGKAEK